MTKQSAGLLMYRTGPRGVEVLLVHPGGPFWKNKDLGAWSVPKGEFGEGENGLDAARREFLEETGIVVDGPFVPLSPVRQPGGKIVFVWMVSGTCDPTTVRSNTFSLEWPPRSGRVQECPEVDKAAWFDLAEARRRILKGQVALLDELEERLRGVRS